jgi:hypothetical protein
MYAFDSFEKANRRVFHKSLERFKNEKPTGLQIDDVSELTKFFEYSTNLENELNKVIADTTYFTLQPMYGPTFEPKIREILPNIRKAIVSLGKIRFNSLPDVELNQLKEIKDRLNNQVITLESELENLRTGNVSPQDYRHYKSGIDTFFGDLKRMVSSLNDFLVSTSRVSGGRLPTRFM